MTEFNYWHIIVLTVIAVIYLLGIVASFKQGKAKLVFPMIVSITLIVVIITGFSMAVVDKYTKVAKLYKLDNKRMLQQEKIMYSGIVKNEGAHVIGKVTFEIKLVNKGMATGNVKGGNFYKPSGFLDFFSSKGEGILYKPQQVTQEFVVATKLKPGQAKAFRVYFDYPPYFRSVSHFSKLYAH
ncbi:DUF2393 domain-containing protein [Sulfurimonas sp.]|nr:DUF2393 domain-containing protein [Sulfurimonas sp.]